MSKQKEPKLPRARLYLERQKERGMVVVNVWVPKKDATTIRKIAYDMRKKDGFETKRGEFIYGEEK